MTEKLTMELKALKELMGAKVKVEELYGVSIDNLVGYAQSRRDGVEQLRKAQEILFEITGANGDVAKDQAKAKSAIVAVDAAGVALRQARDGYANVKKLNPALNIVDAQLAEVETLRRSIALWWRQQIYEQLHQARLHLVDPTTEQSVEEAREFVKEARLLLQHWRNDGAQDKQLDSTDITKTDGAKDEQPDSTDIAEADSAIKEVEGLLQKKESALFNVQLNEASYWLDLAKAYLEESPTNDSSDTQTPGQNQGENVADVGLTPIYAAFACLSRAKMLLDDLSLEQTSTSGSSRNVSQNRAEADAAEPKGQETVSEAEGSGGDSQSVQLTAPQESNGTAHDPLLQEKGTLADRYSTLLKQARKALQQGMGAKEKSILKLVAEVKQKHQSFNPPEAFLEGADNCNLVDQLRYHLYLFPDIDPPPEIKKVLMLRADNVRESYRLYRQAKQESEQNLYEAYMKLNQAQRLNPTDEEIAREQKEMDEKWKEALKNLVAEISKEFNKEREIDFQTLASKKGSSALDKKWDEFLRMSGQGGSKDWDEVFKQVKSVHEQHIWWIDIATMMKSLVDQWNSAAQAKNDDQRVDDDLLKQTDQLLTSIKNSKIGFPHDGPATVAGAIDKALADSNGNEIFQSPFLIEKAIELQDQFKNVGETATGGVQ